MAFWTPPPHCHLTPPRRPLIPLHCFLMSRWINPIQRRSNVVSPVGYFCRNSAMMCRKWREEIFTHFNFPSYINLLELPHNYFYVSYSPIRRHRLLSAKSLLWLSWEAPIYLRFRFFQSRAYKLEFPLGDRTWRLLFHRYVTCSLKRFRSDQQCPLALKLFTYLWENSLGAIFP